LQPSWILRLGRVRSPAASSTGAEGIALREDIADVDIAVVGRVWLGQRNQLGDLGFVGIAHDPRDAGEGRQFGRARCA